MICTLCPRNCNTERNLNVGVCGTHGAVISRVAKHFWEEPCISGTVGSGTVFFAGCNLKCRFCQNYDISVIPHGVEVSPQRLADIFLYVQQSGAANLNLVTPGHVAHVAAKALELCKSKLNIPVVYNTSSYEKVSALKMMDGLVDVYLPDLKFVSSEVSEIMCRASNYFEIATAAIAEMKRQQPQNIYNEGYIQRGLIIRHLVLPGFVEDSKRVLDWIANFDKNSVVSLMSQYFPARNDDKYPQLNRRLYKHEYENIKEYFFNLGLKNGYMQDLASATKDYLPEFDDSTIEETLKSIPKFFD